MTAGSALWSTRNRRRWAVLPSAENLTAVRKAVPASRRGEVSAQLKNGKPFLLRGVSDIEAPGADAFFVPVRSRDRQLAAHIVGYTDGGRRAFEETNYVPIF